MAIKVYRYTDDTGEETSVRLNEDLAAAGGFESGQEGSGVMGPTPFNRLRGVYAISSTGKRIFVPCATQDVELYATKSSQDVTYKGTTYRSISSRGEKRLHGAASTTPAN